MNQSKTARPLRWGIIGAGHIAREFADGIGESQTGVLAAIGSRSQSGADQFAAVYEGIRAHGSYQALLDDSEIDAVYIATPHPMHAEWTIKAAEAGKHILVEKPIGMNAPEAAAMIDAAMENDVFLMEAFMYRCHPQTAKLAELIRSGAIGEVRLIRASFCYDGGSDLSSRAFAPELGGGGIWMSVAIRFRWRA
jgi:predicted dehydrogenase